MILESIHEETPKPKQANLPGHDDSGYDGLGSASKVPDHQTVQPFNAEKIRNLLEASTASSPDKFWVTATHYLMVIVVVASVCHIIMMGDKNNDDYPAVELGGKRAAIKYYYDSVHGGDHDGI